MHVVQKICQRLKSYQLPLKRYVENIWQFPGIRQSYTRNRIE